MIRYVHVYSTSIYTYIYAISCRAIPIQQFATAFVINYIYHLALSLLSLFSHCSCPRDLSVNLSVRGMHTESVPVTMFYSMYAYLSHIPRLHALGIAVCAYVVYYLIQVVKVSRESAKLGLCNLNSSEHLIPLAL